MKKTKILATFGPSIESPRLLQLLVGAGVNAFRVNCSHGDRAYFMRAAAMIRKAAASSAYPVGLLFDISGPKFRLARFSGELAVSQKDTVTLWAGPTDLAARLLGVNNKIIIRTARRGQRLFIDDGRLMFEVIEVGRDRLRIRAQNSGVLLPGKGLNLPDTKLPVSAVTAKDRADIKTACDADAEFIALSFVRSADDILKARRLVRRLGGRQKIIAKLEMREAIEHLEEIMSVSDGVMVARGDLGVELPPAEVPRVQKRIIKLANRHHKPVIVATQMLESMRFEPRATRAEINDVASAVFGCADAVMLSAETATGRYPLEAVRTMRDVIEATEADGAAPDIDLEDQFLSSPTAFSIARAVSQTDRRGDTRAIFAFTTSGFTAALISSLFPTRPVIALTRYEKVARQLAFYRSVYAVAAEQPASMDEMMAVVNRVCRERRLAKRGDKVIVTGGTPFGSAVPTNFMLIQEVS